ncbi:MAG TPA: hypothetical protein ENN84_02895 [Candidatus Marinimicrobia bacterium]|nr:hypothetical protein [Candidatus Neomarinimicrobiota bacterium]
MKRLILLALIPFILYPCTSAIISGKATIDGRPLLWKHRDTDELENKAVYVAEAGKLAYIGIANHSDSLNQEIWMGSNEAGFSIMNTASYNLNIGEKADVPDDQEGLFMRQALEKCRNLADFENMLEATKGERGVAANFGVIDAQGGAAYYETGCHSYVKYDANDPMTAPEGYLIRTNFSQSGQPNAGYGYIRYTSTSNLFFQKMRGGKLSANFLILEASRNLNHSLLQQDLRKMPPSNDALTPHYVLFRDYVVRHNSASVLVVRGVKKDENPELSALYYLPGWSLSALTIPLWVALGENFPDEIKSKSSAEPPILNQKALLLKKLCYPVTAGSGESYLNLSPLINVQNGGFDRKIREGDQLILNNIEALLLSFYDKQKLNHRDIQKFYKWYIPFVLDFYAQGNTQ